MASVHKDKRGKSPYWYAAYTEVGGVRRFKSTKLVDKKKALALAQEWERLGKDIAEQDPTGAQISKINREIYQRVTGNRVDVVYVGTYLKEWAERSRSLKAKATAQRYHQVITDFLSHIGEVRQKSNLGSISSEDVQKFVSNEISSGKSETTISVTIKVLRIPFNRAFRQGLIFKNPVADVEMPNAHAQERKAFTWEQVKKLTDAATDDWKTAILLSAYCGMRLGDCVNLKWADVNFAKEIITYLPEKTKRRKTRKTLAVPIHPTLSEHLHAESAKESVRTYVCPALHGRSPSGCKGLSTIFVDTIMKKAEIDPLPSTRAVTGKGRVFHQLTFHSLRHSFNSELANLGVSQEIRKVMTGHSSNEMNDVYSKFESGTLKNAVDKLPK